MKLANALMGRGEAALRWKLALGNYMRTLRLAKDMTQEEVVRLVSWQNKQMLSGIETGRTSVPTDHLVALAGALGVPPVEFAKRVLRYQDPWTYEVLFEDEEVRRELEAITQPRMATRRGPRQQSWRGSGVH